MKHNVGEWDRNTRFVVGTVAILAAIFAPLPKSWRWTLLGLGTTEFVTGATGYCPVNEVLGIDTTQVTPRRLGREILQNVKVFAE